LTGVSSGLFDEGFSSNSTQLVVRINPCGAPAFGLFVYFLANGIFHLTDSLTQVVAPGQTELTLTQPATYTNFLGGTVCSKWSDLLDFGIRQWIEMGCESVGCEPAADPGAKDSVFDNLQRERKIRQSDLEFQAKESGH
jgi:hypothetical protein